MQTADTIINADLLIAPQNIILENHSLVIDQGKIKDLLPTGAVKQKWRCREEIFLNDHVLMPGLINAHAHSPSSIFRGLANDLPLMEWLTQHIWPAELAVLNPESIADGMNLAILEMLRGGITCFCDHFFLPRSRR